MTKMHRSYTVTYAIECLEDNGEKCDYVEMPFPSLRAFQKSQIPIFNVTETIEIDNDAFIEDVAIITQCHSNIWTYSAVLTLLAVIFCTIACCFQSIYLMNTPVDKEINERLENLDKIEKMTNAVDEPANQPFFIL